MLPARRIITLSWICQTASTCLNWLKGQLKAYSFNKPDFPCISISLPILDVFKVLVGNGKDSVFTENSRIFLIVILAKVFGYRMGNFEKKFSRQPELQPTPNTKPRPEPDPKPNP